MQLGFHSLTGQKYSYWKQSMMIYLQFVDYNLWSIVVKVSHVPKSTTNGKTIEKPVEEWDHNDKKLCSTRAKAMNILYYEFKLMKLIGYQCPKMLKKYGTY